MRTHESSHEASPVPTGCCPPFDPTPWKDAEIVWANRPFLKEHVPAFFHVPIGMGAKIVRAKERIEAAHAEPAQPLMLADESSNFGTDLYIDVTAPIPGAPMAWLSGTFLTRVYEGPFPQEPAWAKDMVAYVASKGRTLEKLYFAWTTCPACAKAYGHNYVIGFAQVHAPEPRNA